MNEIKTLSDDDKQHVLNYTNNLDYAKYFTDKLSIFSKSYTLTTFDNYKYLKTYKNCDIFYIPSCHMFIDKDKRILIYSSCTLEDKYKFIKNIDTIIKTLNNIDLSNSIDIGSSYVACEKWFVSYGHFKDEMFTLYDFMHKYNKENISNYKPLMQYPISQEECKNYRIPKNNHNYTKIDELLFKKSLFNLNTNVVSYKLTDLILISHDFNSPTFHKFPRIARDHILSQVDINVNNINTNVFLTRSIGLHIPRIVDNLDELNNYFKQRNYDVINPEDVEYTELIKHLINAKNIFLTWGGVMVLLMYVNPQANIYILRGKSYEHEQLSIIKNLISNYGLYNIKVIDHVNNIINISDIEKYIV
jgi:hypothetical protein